MPSLVDSQLCCVLLLAVCEPHLPRLPLLIVKLTVHHKYYFCLMGHRQCQWGAVTAGFQRIRVSVQGATPTLDFAKILQISKTL